MLGFSPIGSTPIAAELFAQAENAIDDRNLLDYSTWTAGTGNAVGFTRNGDIAENVRFLAENPWGETEMVWEARPLGQVGGGDGGWNGDFFPIDNTRTYRFSVWINRTVRGLTGRFYFGTRSYTAAYLTLAARSNGSQTNNPYFWSSANPWQYNLNEWYLVVGHVWPVGSGTGVLHSDSGIYTRSGGKIGSITTDWVWLADSVNTCHRAYLFYSEDPTTRQRWIRPRVDLIDGTEPTIQDLLDGWPVGKHIASGGIAFAGESDAYPSYIPEVDGGIHFDGESEAVQTYLHSSDGSIQFSGATEATPSYSPAVDGGMQLAGESVVVPTYSPAVDGGMIFGGSTEATPTYSPLVSAGIAFAGESDARMRNAGTIYWVSTTARLWNDANGWSLTSGGTPGVIPPAAIDTAVFNGADGDCTLIASVAVADLQTTTNYTGRLNLAGYELQADTATLRHPRLTELNGTLSVIDSSIVSNSDPGRVKIDLDEGAELTGSGNLLSTGGITLQFFVPSIILELDTEGQLRLTDDCFIPGRVEIGSVDLDGHNLTVADDLIIRPDTSINDWGTINVLGEWLPITEAASIAFASGESDAYPVYCPLADGGIEFDGESIHIPTYCPLASDGSIEFDGSATATIRRVASRMRASIRTLPAFAGRVARY